MKFYLRLLNKYKAYRATKKLCSMYNLRISWFTYDIFWREMKYLILSFTANSFYFKPNHNQISLFIFRLCLDFSTLIIHISNSDLDSYNRKFVPTVSDSIKKLALAITLISKY